MSAAPSLWHDDASWKRHSGIDLCPIPPESTVLFQFACGKISPERRAGDFIWGRRGWDFDVRAYKVVQMGEWPE